jgi:Tol biopolymer transport system component/DNA-binding winged helix-turn-helix (wHTH) protein
MVVSRYKARFERFQVDLSAHKLQRSGIDVPIQGKPLQLLRLLLLANGEVVTREQLRAALWPEESFGDFEHGVNTAVKKLRQALGDSADRPKFVETVPKVGYRFIEQVEWVPNECTKPELRSSARAAPNKRLDRRMAAILTATVVVVAAGICFATYVKMGRSSQAAPGEWRLTANPVDTPVTSGVISPDGRFLAYTDTTGFYLRQIETGETHPIALPEGVEALVESWFPDGVHLLASWTNRLQAPPGLWRISVMGGVPRKVVEEGSSAALSPDGSYIVFVRHTSSAEEIWLVDADGAKPKRLFSSQEDSFSRAAWAPDAKRFALARTRTRYYAGRRADDTQIEVFDLASQRRTVVVSEGDRGLPRGGAAIAWTPDGRLIYPRREPRPSQQDTNLWWVRLDSGLVRVVGRPARITRGTGIAVECSVSRDGKRLALRRHAPQADIYIAELSGEKRRLSNPRRLTLDERLDYATAWTADSKTVVFYSNRGGTFHVFKQAIDATQPELLVGGDDDLYLPRLSPDGSSVLYVIRPKPGGPTNNARLMRVPVTGGAPRLVFEAPDIWDIECARLPSPVCVGGQNQTGKARIFKFDSTTGQRVGLPVIERKIDSFNWSLSPDGKYFAWPSEHTTLNEFGVRIFSVEGEWKQDMAVPDWAEISNLDWAPDCMGLWACARNPRGRSALLNIRMNGDITTSFSSPSLDLHWAIPSPDGRRLALVADSNSSNMWLLESF